MLFDTFKKSGVYDSSTFAPVWLVDWYAYDFELVSSPNLEDLVRVNRYGMEQDWGLAFYHQGLLTRRYSCDELLRSLNSKIFFRNTSANWHTDWYDTFGSNRDMLVFTTQPRLLGLADKRLNLGMQDSWVFSLRDGQVLGNKTMGTARFLGFILGLVVMLLTPFGIWLLRRGRRRRPGPEV
ncbi:MAG: hypothetical protein V4726_12560 [Verrucomicrobiota bacterium]